MKIFNYAILFLCAVTCITFITQGVKRGLLSEQIPVPGQDPEVVTVIEYSNLVKDCVWEDPCEFVEANAYHQRVKWLMDNHRMQAAMLNGYWEDETCSIDD